MTRDVSCRYSMFAMEHKRFALRVCAVLALAAGISFTSIAQNGAPTLTLHGDITRADFETYKEVPFTVPAGVTRISVEYSYTDRDKKTVMDIGISDPQRFRGWAGGAKTFFTLSESDTTPAFLAGPIVPGVWHIRFGIPNIRAGVTSHYELKIWFGHEGDVTQVSTFSRAPLRKGPAWFRGDLHMHDAHSDGKCQSRMKEKVSCPLYLTVEAAAARKLDFISITDHNTTAHFSDMRELQPYFDNMLLIPGREITTFYGHANVWGTTDPIDFRLQHGTVAADFKRLQARVEQLHAMLSLNHPAHPSGEDCMGCGWTVPDMDWSKITTIEAVNGSDYRMPKSSIPYWQDKLNRGFRIPAVGGSDTHTAEEVLIGRPTTVVYANDLSERSILDAIRAGHAFIDTEGSQDRAIEFTAVANGKTAMMGDALRVGKGERVKLRLRMQHLTSAHAELIVDGNVAKLLDEKAATTADEVREGSWTSDGARHWLRVNVRAANGDLLIVGNPVFVNF